jgi:RNA polymerase sigma-70 factor (ECF subfamily)
MAGSEPAQKVRLDKAKEAEERRLVEAAQRDPVCFAKLYESYFELVYVYVARRVRNRAETEDLTAEVFRKALANLPRFKWTGAPFAAWLFRIASNMIADRAKRAAREGKLASGESEPSLTVGLLTRGEQQTDLEQCERRAQLFHLVDELAEDQRRVVVMRFAEEKSIGEIARELGRSEGAVKQLQFRALENLRKKIYH